MRRGSAEHLHVVQCSRANLAQEHDVFPVVGGVVIACSLACNYQTHRHFVQWLVQPIYKSSLQSFRTKSLASERSERSSI